MDSSLCGHGGVLQGDKEVGVLLNDTAELVTDGVV